MKYIAYTRKSTDESDRQILSIESQTDELKEFAARQNLEILEFVTEAKTAKSPGREKFNQVLKRIEKGEAQGIISWHPDRLARNSVDDGKIIYLLDTGKLLDLKFPSFWFENSPQGKFVLNIAFGQSKYYVDNLSENVKRGLRTLLKKGVLPTKSLKGYIYNERLTRHDIDPVKRKVIKKAFEMYATGEKNQTDVGLFLMNHGFASRSGGMPNVSTIYKLLSNKFYIGIFKFNGELYQGTHETFISKSLFAKVQKQLELRMRKKFKKRNFPFIGLVKCGECGASVTGEYHTKFYRTTRGLVEYYMYRCTKKLKPCTQKYIAQDELEKQMRKAVSDVAIPQAWIPTWLKLFARDEVSEKQNQEQNMVKLEEEAKVIDQKLNLLLDSYLENIVDAETYKNKKNELFERKLKIQEEIGQTREVGSSWLEPFSEFLNVAKDCGKIVSAKNNCEELVHFARNVGSNFFLENRQLSVTYKKGFDTLQTCFAPGLTSREILSHSFCERDTRIELASHPWEGRILPLY